MNLFKWWSRRKTEHENQLWAEEQKRRRRSLQDHAVVIERDHDGNAVHRTVIRNGVITEES